jgi:hypothetical protein
MTADQARSIAARADEAYRFDLQQHAWGTPPKGPFTVVISSHVGADDAVTVAPNRIQLSTTALHETPDHLGRTDHNLAHELTHMQFWRAGGDKGYDKFPLFLQEGWAVVVGDRFSSSKGEPGFSRTHADDSTHITAEAAQQLLNRPSGAAAETWQGETTGALFVEFLRTRMNQPDIVQKLAKVGVEVGQGAPFEAAFQRELGVNWKQTTGAFVSYLRETEGKPKARLAGTLWASLTPERAELGWGSVRAKSTT